MLGSLASLVIVVYVPFFNTVFHTRHVRELFFFFSLIDRALLIEKSLPGPLAALATALGIWAHAA